MILNHKINIMFDGNIAYYKKFSDAISLIITIYNFILLTMGLYVY